MEDEKVEWKPVVGYENEYKVSSDGRVFALKRKYFLKPTNTVNGYFKVNLSKNNKASNCRIHKLVAEAFIPYTENKPCIDHIDGNKTNNNASNLRWATQTENSWDTISSIS